LSEVLDYEDLLGTPWKKAGRTVSGLDCYGLVKILCARIGVELPEISITPEDNREIDALVKKGAVSIGEPIDRSEPYCLVTFAIRPPYESHIGLVLPEGRFIHVLRNREVAVERLSHPYWRGKVSGFYRCKRKSL